MADPASVYTLTSSAGTVAFNNGTFGVNDMYWINDIPDLDDPPIRAPSDPVPFGDGALIFDAFTGLWHIPVEGHFLVVSTRVQNNIRTIRNSMEETLRNVLRAMRAPNSGTLAWTPLGQSARSLTVYYEVALRCPHDQNFMLRSFSFGLFSGQSSW